MSSGVENLPSELVFLFLSLLSTNYFLCGQNLTIIGADTNFVTTLFFVLLFPLALLVLKQLFPLVCDN